MHRFVAAVGMNEREGVKVRNECGSNKQRFFSQLGSLLEVSARRPNIKCFLDKYVSHHKK